MIEILKKDGKWIAFNGGGIMDYDDDLECLFKNLAHRADDIEKEWQEDNKAEEAGDDDSE